MKGLVKTFGTYRIKSMYYIEDQEINVFDKDQLKEDAFEVYQQKRLVRTEMYYKRRDKSMDFLCIGEDDLDEFDDFV